MSDDGPGLEYTSGYMSWDDERRARYDEARDRLTKAISDLVVIEAGTGDDPPFVQGWVAAAEWTNVDLERKNAGGRYVFSPHGQMLSISEGLAHWSLSRFI